MTPDKIQYLVVHCSKTSVREGDGLAVVERKCRKRGALSCGYHFVISRDGRVQNGRGLDEAGNHALGYNDCSLGICLVGMSGTATPKQKESLRTHLSILKEKFPAAQPVTHEQLQPKSGAGCPGFSLKG